MTASSISRLRTLIAVTTAVLGLALCIHGGVAAADLLCLAPALALAALMFMRRYPGERVLVRLAARGRRLSRRAGLSLPLVPRPPLCLPRGGLLMAFGLAVRPPPRALLVS